MGLFCQPVAWDAKHVASVLFYLEATTRIHEKLVCTQVKCSWIFADICQRNAVCEG